MNLEKALNEIRSYLAGKLLNGDYEFISCTEHTCLIKIDGYELYVWIYGNPIDSLSFYDFSDKVLFNNNTFETNLERSKAWDKLKPHVIAYKNEQLRKEKEEIIRILENELNNI